MRQRNLARSMGKAGRRTYKAIRLAAWAVEKNGRKSMTELQRLSLEFNSTMRCTAISRAALSNQFHRIPRYFSGQSQPFIEDFRPSKMRSLDPVRHPPDVRGIPLSPDAQICTCEQVVISGSISGEFAEFFQGTSREQLFWKKFLSPQPVVLLSSARLNVMGSPTLSDRIGNAFRSG